MKKRGVKMSLQQAEAHQRKHGFLPLLQQAVDETQKKIKEKKLRREPKMNKTETEFSWILEAQKRRGEIVRWLFEGITLQWGGLRYTPDFTVLMGLGKALKFIETKGPYIGHGDAIVKFKAARAEWTEFEFEFWQKKEGAWNQLL